MRSRFMGALVILLLLPLGVFAVSQETPFITEIRTFLRMLERDIERGERIEYFDRVEGTDAFFSDGGEEALPDALKTGKYVAARIDGTIVTFEDVPRSQWFAAYVERMMSEGVLSGYRSEGGEPLGIFGPEDEVTIEQLAKIAVRLTGMNVSSCTATTKNPLARGQWSQTFIACAEQLKFAVFSDGAVDIHRPATRAEVVATVLQAYGIPFGARRGGVFSDVTAGTVFASAIERAAKDHVVSGHTDETGTPTGLFKPEDPVNRAETAKIATMAIQVYGEE